MKRFLQIGIPVLLIVIVLSSVFLLNQTTVDAQSNDNSASIEQQDINVTVDGVGVISPERTLYLSFTLAETVTEVNVVAGDAVAEGDVLAALETNNLQLQVDAAQAGVDAAQASYDMMVEEPTELELAQTNATIAAAQSQLANATLAQDTADEQILVNCVNLSVAEDALDAANEAYEDYIQTGFELDPDFLADPESPAGNALRDAQNNYDVTQAQCDMTTTNVSNDAGVIAAQAQLEQAEAALNVLLDGASDAQIASAQAQLDSAGIQLEQAQNRLDDALLIAPFDGLITDVAIVEDQIAGTGAVAITLIDINQYHIMVQIDEMDITSIEIGQVAEITLDAIGEDTILMGSVSRITPQANTTQGITNYAVRVDLVDEHEDILPGMSADVDILVAVEESVFVVPRRAIQRNDELGEFITVRVDGTDSDIAVTPGYSADGYIVIEGDVEAGQTVVIVED